MNKKLIPFMFIFVLLLSGCKSSPFPKIIEVDEFEVIQVVGLDLDPISRREVEVTFLGQDTTGTNSKESSGSKLISMTSSVGPTIFEAERKIKNHSDKVTFFGYVDYYLIGEDAARDDISKYIDFLIRDHETRLSPKVYIIRNVSAKDLLFTTSSSDIPAVDAFKGAKYHVDSLSNTHEVSLVEIAEMLDVGYAGIVIPAMKTIAYTNEKSTGELPEKDICACGYAILKDFKLAGYYEGASARGYNIITNNVSSFPVSVLDPTGKMVGVEVISTKTKVEARFEGDKPVEVTFKTIATANIQEEQGRSDLFTQDMLEKLKKSISNNIHHEMEQAIAVSEKVGIDSLELGKQMRKRYPAKWDKIRDDWRSIFPELEISVEVETRIARTYDVREPAGKGR